MTKDASFHDYVMQDIFGEIPGITSRMMFGGWGLYRNGIIFGIIADEELFFKVDDSNRGDFEKNGSRPFVYAGCHDKPITMSYWLLPQNIMEDPEQLKHWLDRSVAASQRSKKKKC